MQWLKTTTITVLTVLWLGPSWAIPLLVLTGLALGSMASCRELGCCSPASADCWLVQRRELDHMFLITIQMTKAGLLMWQQKVSMCSMGQPTCASSLHDSTWITFATIHPTGQSKLHDQVQCQCGKELPKLWMLKGEAFVAAFAIWLFKFKLAFKVHSLTHRKAYQAYFYLHTITLLLPSSWNTLSTYLWTETCSTFKWYVLLKLVV